MLQSLAGLRKGKELAINTVAFLRDQGYDAVHLREQRLQQLQEDGIIGKARAQGRVIMTHDLDFGEWLLGVRPVGLA